MAAITRLGPGGGPRPALVTEAPAQSAAFSGSLSLASAFAGNNPQSAAFAGDLAIGSAFVVENLHRAAFAGDLAIGSAFVVENLHRAAFAGDLALASAFQVSNSQELDFAGAISTASSFAIDNKHRAAFSGDMALATSFAIDNPPTIEFAGDLSVASSFAVANPHLAEFAGDLSLASAFDINNAQRVSFSGDVSLASSFSVDNPPTIEFSADLGLSSAFAATNPQQLAFSGDVGLASSFLAENSPLVEFSANISISSAFDANSELALQFSGAVDLASRFQIGAISTEFSADLVVQSAFAAEIEEIFVAYPNTYSRTKDFTEEGGSASDHVNLNAELDALGAIINQLNTNLQILQRSDTAMGNETVHPRAFNAASLALMANGSAWNIRGEWATATDYVVSDLVEEDGASYVCAVAHTAGVFATDLAAVYWIPLAPESVSTVEAQAIVDDSLQGTRANWATGSGTGNSMTANMTPALTAYANGMRLTIRSPGANTITNPTINIDGLGSRTITKYGGRALVAGDIDQAGHELHLAYRSASSSFDLLNPAARVQATIGHTLLQAADAAAVRSAIVAPGTGVDNTYTKRQTYAYNTIASAAELDLSSADGNYLYVTGGTGITSISAHGVGTPITLTFAGAVLLTHHATNLILPTGANITTAAGDVAVFLEYASGDWRCIGFTRADGSPLGAAIPAGTLLLHSGLTEPDGGYLLAYGQAVSRATEAAIFAATTLLTDGDVTNASAVITNIPDTSEMRAGMPLEGASFATGTTISSVDSGTQITASNNWTGATGTDEPIRVLPHGQGDGSTTFNLVDMRDRVPVGRGDMGGSSASRLASSVADGVGETFGAHNGATSSNVVSHSGGGSALISISSNGVVQPSMALNYWVKK